jgi:hypothetical protein
MRLATITAATITAGIVLSAATAHADWQYTRWGMTPEETLAASKGKLKRCDPRACDVQATDTAAAQLFGPYQSGEFNFTAFAFFDKRTNKLAHVTLKLTTPEKGLDLIGTLRIRYGEPAMQSTSAVMTLLGSPIRTRACNCQRI